ncbi:MAG TPA: M24 family metallopeptidase [Patescibacteria group bacterium]|nr:M24 family metallopeptidase [Patescibacteria group bacterium]
MARTRREFLIGSAVAAGTAATGMTGLGVGGARAAAGRSGIDAAAATAAGDRGSAALLRGSPDHPKPATSDRLDEPWHRARVRLLQQKLADEGLGGALLGDRWNLIYFTGLWFTSTERPFMVYVPAAGDMPTLFHPGLDRDLVATWWITDHESYFDFKHGEGAFPNLGKVQMGATVDLQRWILKGLRQRGAAGKPLGVDGPITADLTTATDEILPGTALRKAGEICERMRMRKTPEEIALTQRAMDSFSRVHAFARDYVLARGTDATDHEVQCETQRYAADLVMNDVRRDGKPHTAVGVQFDIEVRTGIGTAYPHPNQFHHNRIRKGDALQIAGVLTIGGCGGELYRAYQIEPWDAAREKVWQVHTDCCRIQAEESAAGVTCSYVAKKVHDHQVANGLEKYIYHRPAHGQGWEGHQPPYIALGDHTMLEEGMMFSNEPGLYAPDLGCGYNHSDVVLVGPKRGQQMSSVPFTKEWCTLKL